MSDHAKATILGRLCRDWELRYTASNKAVASNTIAATHKYGDSEKTLFLRITAWQKTAETLNQYTSKGQRLFVEVRLETDEWTDQQGNKRSTVQGVVESFTFIERRDDQPQQRQQQPAGAGVGGSMPGDDFDAGDPPF